MAAKKCTHNSPPDKLEKVPFKTTIHAFREKACPVLGLKAANKYYMNTYKPPIGKIAVKPNEVAPLTFKDKCRRILIILKIYVTGKATVKVNPSDPPNPPA